uniref:Uncharacterized protein n=1 Tax=uncultured Armatimonadetes bacterium TaxID=157466 RepID=A0A6J4JLV0_9BACT|nr:hypothetical protein AVDCRST_MAG63-3620 [uncultured Armatimonadetes bacterium]
MTVLRKLAAALLLTAVGFAVGGFFGGLFTFYVYFIGLYLGAPVGALVGGLLGWRTPLRDSVLLFVAVYQGGAVGAVIAGSIRGGRADGGFFLGLLDLLLPAGGAALGAVLLFLPVRRFVPFDRRRGPAAVAAAGFALWLLWRLVFFAYIWQPS